MAAKVVVEIGVIIVGVMGVMIVKVVIWVVIWVVVWSSGLWCGHLGCSVVIWVAVWS